MFALQWTTSIVFVCVVSFLALVSCDVRRDFTNGLLNALQTDSLANVIGSARREHEQNIRSGVAERDQMRINSLQDGYDDALCYDQLEALREGLNKSQIWAFQGTLAFDA